MKKNNLLSFMFIMFIVAMIGMPNLTPKATNHHIINKQFLPISFPWATKSDELALINCINYDPDNDTSIQVMTEGMHNDQATEALTLKANSQKTFFINELKSFDKIHSNNGIVTLSSRSKNVFCYVNYYSYDDEDNINGIASITKNDSLMGNSYFIYNEASFPSKIKSVNLYIHNVSPTRLNATIKSFSKKGTEKNSYNIKDLKQNDVKVIKLPKKKDLTYHIIPQRNNIKYITYIKVILENKIITFKPLQSFINSDLLPLTNKTIIANLSPIKQEVTASIYSKSKEVASKNIKLNAFSQKTVNLKNGIANLSSPTIKLKNSSNSVVAISKQKNKTQLFVDEEVTRSTDVLIGYNLSLGEKANLNIANNNNENVTVTIFINSNSLKTILLPAYSQVTLNLNKLINRKNLIGYLYISSNKKISAKLNSIYEKKLEYTNLGQAILDVTLSGIETPEYIIK